MTAQLLFIIFIAIIVFNFVFDLVLNHINAKHYKDAIPPELEGIYDDEEYIKSQDYKQTNYKFGLIQSIFSFVVLLLFIFLNGFKLLDGFSHQSSNNSIVVSLLFFGFIFIANTLVSIPFSYYHNFVIEERFGFNKMTKSLFVKDFFKSLFLSIILGGSVLTAILWFHQLFPQKFWLYAWAFMCVFSILMNLFYTSVIVPLFNKLAPLKEGELKNTLQKFAKKVQFKIDEIFIIDGSKRSTKANAYFSGFGNKKKVVLYDTLLNDLSNEEIAAVLAHEVGHYKKKHIVYNLVLSLLLTGFTLYILSLFINNPILAQAFGISEANFHIGTIVFAILYTPISVVTRLLMNILSRKFEYQADNYAKQFGYSDKLINALKKLSKSSFSNLTPHKFYVFMHYSHPTLLQRFTNLKQ
ncbi:MAG: M48 family metallopeptidase [Flavobacteriaceae bacterium]|nr:M48 family metallopeptidase [Flavobacteriaceae bacterium]